MATDGYRLFNETTDRNEDDWDHLDPVSRKSWEQRAQGSRAFIPSGHVNKMNRLEAITLAMPAPVVPAHIVPLTSPLIPNGAKLVINRLLKHGWTVLVSYCEGPWQKQTETVDGEDGEEKIKYGQAKSVLVRARRRQQRLGALWLAKPWTKDDGYKFYMAHVRPDIGPVKSPELKWIIETPIEEVLPE
jgi:hypothetical protein